MCVCRHGVMVSTCQFVFNLAITLSKNDQKFVKSVRCCLSVISSKWIICQILHRLDFFFSYVDLSFPFKQIVAARVGSVSSSSKTTTAEGCVRYLQIRRRSSQPPNISGSVLPLAHVSTIVSVTRITPILPSASCPAFRHILHRLITASVTWWVESSYIYHYTWSTRDNPEVRPPNFQVERRRIKYSSWVMMRAHHLRGDTVFLLFPLQWYHCIHTF